MKDVFADVITKDGRMETFITRPDRQGPFPGVILFMDVWGIREELYDIARRIATVGYCVAVPDLYYREGRIRNEYRADDGRMKSLEDLSEAEQNNVLAPLSRLTDTMVVQDAGALITYLFTLTDREKTLLESNAMGSLGYCMGGRHVMSVAAAYPDRFRASVGLHPTNLISDRADSPHNMVDKIRGELYFGFPESDPYAPAPMIEELSQLLSTCPVKYSMCVHKGALHGYALPDRDVFDKQAANRDWEVVFDMFRRQIPPK